VAILGVDCVDVVVSSDCLAVLVVLHGDSVSIIIMGEDEDVGSYKRIINTFI
jgi:hypothetical protein